MPVLIVPMDVKISICIAEVAVRIPAFLILFTVNVVDVEAAIVPVRMLEIVMILVLATDTHV